MLKWALNYYWHAVMPKKLNSLNRHVVLVNIIYLGLGDQKITKTIQRWRLQRQNFELFWIMCTENYTLCLKQFSYDLITTLNRKMDLQKRCSYHPQCLCAHNLLTFFPFSFNQGASKDCLLQCIRCSLSEITKLENQLSEKNKASQKYERPRFIIPYG